MAANNDKTREASEANEDAEEKDRVDGRDADGGDRNESDTSRESGQEGDDADRDESDESDNGTEESEKATAPTAQTSGAKQDKKATVSTSKSPSAAQDDGDDDQDGDDEEEEERDDAAPRVAQALGVGDELDEEKPAGDQQEGAPAPNRAARRRDEVRERRRKTTGKAASASAKKGDEDAPKDKNARAKELLLRRREQAGRRAVGANLLPGEMVDDALARSTSAAGKWFRKNFHILQWVILAGAVGTGVFLFMNHRERTKAADASGDLARAVAAEHGLVMAEDKRSDDEKEFDHTPVFKTPEERADTAMASYNKVIEEAAGTGASILAKLGQAGISLEKKEWQAALEAFMVVQVSPLATADADVKGRAIEGAGFAKEGKGDLDGALLTFKELEAIDLKGYKELAMYHQARIHLAKGDKEKAKELLKAAREKLTVPSTDGPKSQFLERVVEETLRRIDPSAIPAKTQLTGPKGNSFTPEELQRMLQKAQEGAAKKKAAEPHDGEEN